MGQEIAVRVHGAALDQDIRSQRRVRLLEARRAVDDDEFGPALSSSAPSTPSDLELIRELPHGPTASVRPHSRLDRFSTQPRAVAEKKCLASKGTSTDGYEPGP